MISNVSGRITALLIALLVFMMALAACSGRPAQTQEPTREATSAPAQGAAVDATQAPAALEGSADPQRLMIPRWFLASLTVDGKPVEIAPDQQSVTLQFEPGGKVNGTGGCNNFSATFQADYDGSMSFGPILSTKMACAESMNIETAYFDALSKVQRFSTQDGLVLSSADGKTEIVFHMPPK